MANDEVKKENDAEEKKTESDKAEKEFDAAKWRLITIASTIGLAIAAIAFFVITYFCDDSGRSLIEYIEQGLVVFVALISGCVSIISMINGKENDIEQQKREKQLINEQREREDRLRKEQGEREDILIKQQGEREDILIKQQKEFEEKWNQKKIDADLKANARIEWIQEVRKATSRFISACYCLVRMEEKLEKDNNKDEMKKVFPRIQEIGLLLILYFGPDKKGENEDIANRVNDILNRIEKFVIDDIKGKTNERIEINERKLKRDDIGLAQICNISNKQRSIVAEYKTFIDKLENDLREFNGMIRKYLKIEWDRAKNNED